MKEEIDNSFSIRDFYNVLFRHKASIIILLFSTILTVTIGVYVWPETYEAKATILVKLGRENISIPTVPTSSQQQVITSAGLRKEDISSEIEIIENRQIMEKAIEKLGIDFLYPQAPEPKTTLEKIKYEFKLIFKKIMDAISNISHKIDLKKRLPPNEKAVLAVQKNLSAKQVNNSDVIEVKFKWFDPFTATKVLDTLIDNYLEHHLEAHRISGGYEFFKRQVEITGKRLKDSEERLELLKKRQKITSYQDQSRLLLEQIISFKASLKMNQTEITETTTKIDELKRQMSSLIEAVTPGFDEAYKEAEKELLMQEVQLKTLNARKNELEGHIESFEKDLERLNLYDIDIVRLERQIQIDEENYRLYRKKLEETRIFNILDTERIMNVRVIDPAVASLIPVKPKKLMIIGLGVVLSLVIGIGFAFFSDYIDHSIKTVEDVKRYLNLPLLASIRKVKKWKVKVTK